MSYTVMHRADGRFTISAHVPVESLEQETADRLLEALGPIVASLEQAAGRVPAATRQALPPAAGRGAAEPDARDRS